MEFGGGVEETKKEAEEARGKTAKALARWDVGQTPQVGPDRESESERDQG